MLIAKNIKPISYLKSNASDVAKELAEGREDLVITTNGVPSFVCIDVKRYDEMNETMAMLKLLNMDADDEGENFNSAMADLKKEIFG